MTMINPATMIITAAIIPPITPPVLPPGSVPSLITKQKQVVYGYIHINEHFSIHTAGKQ